VHFINGEQKTLPTARRPAALLTLSRQQDESGCTKFNKRIEVTSIDVNS